MQTYNAVSFPGIPMHVLSEMLSMTAWFFTVDHSRCILKPVEGHEHDYINANFIDVSTHSFSLTFT